MRRFLGRLQLQRVVYMLIVAVLVVSLGATDTAWAGGFGSVQAKVVFYGEPVISTLQPVLFQDRAYVPAEAYSLLGLQMEWDEASGTLLVNSSHSDSPARLGPLCISNQTVNVVVNGQPIKPEPPAVLHDGTIWLPLRMLSELGLHIGWDARTATAFVGTLSPEELPSVGSLENLQKLVQGLAVPYMYKALEGAIDDSAAPEAGNASQTMQPSHSETNVQVSGVDESDIVKTDGRFIYQVRGQTVSIIRAWPVAEAELLASISFSDQEFAPQELYLEGDQLVVIGQTSGGPLLGQPTTGPALAETSPALVKPAPWYGGWHPRVKAIVYDTSNKPQPRLIREVELEGSYLSSRKIGGHVYLLTNKNLYPYDIKQPFYRDSSAGEDFTGVRYQDIKYFPGQCEPSYLMIASFDLGDPDQTATVDAYLGAGDNVYMSRESLYVAVSRWYDTSTQVFRFAVDHSSLTFTAKGEVPGHILNQFSMDEYDRHFRVATTSRDEHGQTANNVYVLDESLTISGKLEDIAPGERIYSARFMGAKGYLVTFEQVDPLFVLDLANHHQPEILGALKIPGFSTYLHPLDDTHLLGLGRDTLVVERKDQEGNLLGEPIVLQQGLKLAIFDVTDVGNPKELDAITVGGRGSDAEALYNHKALLYERDTELFTFAAELTAEATSSPWEHAAFQFQGALFFDVSKNRGISQIGRVTHLDADDYQKQGYYWGGSQYRVRRVLRIDKNLYVVSDGRITIHGLDLQVIRELTLK